MRNFLAVILAIIAGVTASAGLVAWKLDEVIHQPEPIQEMLGSGEAAQELKASVPNALGDLAGESTDIAVLDDAVNQAVSTAVGEVTSHENFDQAWAQSLELTRAGWVEDITALRDRIEAGEQVAENAIDAQLQLRLNPVAQVGVSVIEDAVAAVPGGQNPDLNLEPELTVQTSIPPVSMLTAEQTVMAEELMTLWPILLVIAGIVFLMSLLIASSGSRWIAWLVTGLVVAVSGAFAKFGFTMLQRHVVDTADNSPELSLLQPFMRAVQEWADPQLIMLMVAGAGVALLGILGGFIASNRSRRRRSQR